MKKESQVQSLWPMIHQKLQNPPPGVNLGGFKVPSKDKVKFESSAPPENPGAIAYVSTEDVNQDGTIDMIHIVSPNFDRHMQGVSAADLNSGDAQRIYQILAPFVETLAHEMGHQKDFNPNLENPFPGGEGAADQVAQMALNNMSIQATNNEDDNVLRSFSMSHEVLSRLVKLANDLDEKNEFDMSDQVTLVAEKIAQDMSKREKNRAAAHGSIRIDGDPFSYERHPEGGYYVAKAPDSHYMHMGARIMPGHEAYGPIHAADISKVDSLGKSPLETAELYGKKRAPQGLGQAIQAKLETLRRLDREADAALRSKDRVVGPGHANEYAKRVNYQQKLLVLDDAIEQLTEAGHNVKDLIGIRRSLEASSKEYTSLIMQREGHAADDMEHAADDVGAKEDGMEVVNEDEAETKVEDDAKDVHALTADASLNAIFWDVDVKTPFGR